MASDEHIYLVDSTEWDDEERMELLQHADRNNQTGCPEARTVKKTGKKNTEKEAENIVR